MFTKHNVSTQHVLKMSSKKALKTIKLQERIHFDCFGSKFFMGSPILWAAERKNGTLEYLKGDGK